MFITSVSSVTFDMRFKLHTQLMIGVVFTMSENNNINITFLCVDFVKLSKYGLFATSYFQDPVFFF